ncbi:Septum formation protein Maf [Candidatus Anstonella stagnisolia]|nr:Septum formation protein Maf [Candidatus Anstonella stagnisolia]
MRIILASSSKSRKKLLKKVFRKFECVKPKVAEKLSKPYSLCAKRLAEKKAESVAKKFKSALVIGSDTIIVCKGKVMRKTGSKKVARASLKFISGKKCTAHTGVCIILKEGSKTVRKKASFVSSALFLMRKLSASDINWYIKTGEPLRKGGCIAVEGKGKKFVKKISGESACIQGLPIKRLKKELIAAGFP